MAKKSCERLNHLKNLKEIIGRRFASLGHLVQWQAVPTAQDERTAFGSGVNVFFNFNVKLDLKRFVPQIISVTIIVIEVTRCCTTKHVSSINLLSFYMCLFHLYVCV